MTKKKRQKGDATITAAIIGAAATIIVAVISLVSAWLLREPHTSSETTLTSTPTSDLQQPPECAQFNLTTEECANIGTNEYSISQEVSFGDSCSSGDWNNTLTITFYSTGKFRKVTPHTDWTEIVEYTQTKKNTYYGDIVYTGGIRRDSITLTFRDNGFDEEVIGYSDNVHDCTWLMSSTIIK